MTFRVDQIDHAELVVPSRSDAAEWYRRVLGLQIIAEYQSWADDPQGPLMMETAKGGTKIALFERPTTASKVSSGFQLLAFRVDGRRFLEFINSLQHQDLRDRNGRTVSAGDTRDHRLAFSIYFCDPWGNELEITTYDHEVVRNALK